MTISDLEWSTFTDSYDSLVEQIDRIEEKLDALTKSYAETAEEIVLKLNYLGSWK